MVWVPPFVGDEFHLQQSATLEHSRRAVDVAGRIRGPGDRILGDAATEIGGGERDVEPAIFGNFRC